jgi:predicted nucleic acid-binding protein
MSPVFVLDACAMLAVLANEAGADIVVGIYKKAASGEVTLLMNKLNLLEVYYNLFREYGKDHAGNFLDIVRHSPIVVNHEITDSVFMEAGRLKASYKISLADSIALAETLVSGGTLLTADHHEFDALEGKESISFSWIR